MVSPRESGPATLEVGSAAEPVDVRRECALATRVHEVHLAGGKSPVTGDFYRYRYLPATLTGSGNRCFPI